MTDTEHDPDRPAPTTGVPDDPPGLWRRVGWRIIPLVALAYVISYIDRANLGYVAGPLSRDLGIDAAQLGLAAGLFFIGYILVEVPSNMALRRFGARRWISRILVSWGVVTAATAAVTGAGTLYLARILLGFAEAGLAAGVLLYLTVWFPRRQRSWAMSAFFMAIPLSSIVGAPAAAALLTWGQALLGLPGWRALFLVEGALTVVVGLVVLVLLPDRPRDARFLSDAEKDHLEGVLAAEVAEQRSRGAMTGLREALSSGRVWAMAVTFFGVVFGLYPLAFFLPTMISSFVGGADAGANDLRGILLSAVPYVLAILAMVAWGWWGARLGAVVATAAPLVLGAVGLLLAAVTGRGPLFIVAVCLSVVGIYCAMPQFWRIPAIGLTGAAAAGGIALINSVSNLSGFVGPYVTGAIRTATGSYTWALVLIVGVIVVGLVVLVTTGRSMAAHTDTDRA